MKIVIIVTAGLALLLGGCMQATLSMATSPAVMIVTIFMMHIPVC